MVLYCIVLYCIVLYCIALHCIALYCIVLYCIVFDCIVLYCIVLYCIVLFHYYSVSHSTSLSEVLSTTATDNVSKFTLRSAGTGNCKCHITSFRRLRVLYCIVLYLYIYIALLAVQTNQKR